METNNDALINKKLELEIKNLQKPWWKKTQIILSLLAILTPILIALITFIGIWMSGFFDKHKEKLNHDISILEIVRDSLVAEISLFDDSVKILKIDRFEIILEKENNFPFGDFKDLYNRWVINNDNKIKFYNSISKEANFSDFLSGIGITLKISDSLTYKNMNSKMSWELYEKYIKGKKGLYGESDVCNCVYWLNDDVFMTEEKGIKYYEEVYKNIREFFLKDIL